MFIGKRNRNNLTSAAFLSPALISITVLTLIPIIFTIYISITNYNMYHLDDRSFVGFKNYVELLGGDLRNVFFPVFEWTLLFATLSTLGAYCIGLILAILLNNPQMKETNIYRSILIVPWALPATIAILSWQGLLNEHYGGINQLLALVHISGLPWMTDVFWARAGILTVNFWLGYPYMMNVCLGALQSIPPELYESACIDGGGRWMTFRRITFPLVSRATLSLVIASFAMNFNNFGNIYMITQGNPPRADTQYAGYTDILASAGYKLTSWSNRYDLSAALSVVVFLIVGGLTLMSMKLSHSFEED